MPWARARRSGVEHRLVRCDVAEHALDQAGPARLLELEQLAEALAELVLADRAGLESSHRLECTRLLAEQRSDDVRVEPLLFGERPKGLEYVAREDPAEVDEQPSHEWAISRAFSASAGTPVSKSAR